MLRRIGCRVLRMLLCRQPQLRLVSLRTEGLQPYTYASERLEATRQGHLDQELKRPYVCLLEPVSGSAELKMSPPSLMTVHVGLVVGEAEECNIA